MDVAELGACGLASSATPAPASLLASYELWVIEGCDGELVLAAFEVWTELVFLSRPDPPPRRRSCYRTSVRA